MSLFKKIFHRTKTSIGQEPQHENSKIATNPAFKYVEETYKIEFNSYRQLSVIIHDQSTVAGNEFANLIEGKNNEDLIHFFFDNFFASYVKTFPDQFHSKNNDAYSAIIDGL